MVCLIYSLFCLSLDKQPNDANAAAWAYYYAYGQGQPGQQPGAPQQPAAPQQQPAPTQQQQPAQISYAQPSELRVNHSRSICHNV